MHIVYYISCFPCFMWTVCFAPFWPHVLNFWKRRDDPNILFLKYEDLKKVSENQQSYFYEVTPHSLMSVVYFLKTRFFSFTV